MGVTRREFLFISGAMGAGLALSSLGVDMLPVVAYAEGLSKIDKLKSAKETYSLCYHCAVTCGLICSTDTKTGKIINIEGDPDNPINEGSLCAKGAASLQMSARNENRLTRVLYRKPGGDQWEVKTWDWALTRIAKNIKAVRDKEFIVKNAKGRVVNRVEALAHMGSSKLDNEECWMITTAMRALGYVYIDHQARVCHGPSVASLAESLGRGSMTNHVIDIRNSDCVIVMGSNATEAHPITFRWAMRAREKGAKIIHVDPRFTRTSAVADHHAFLRAGTDVAFVGGMIKYILDNNKYFEEYVRNYTNASCIIDDKYSFKDGLFSGYDPATRKYDKSTWVFKLDAKGIPEKDPTFQNPRCVLQMMKAHYARYDLEKVSSITGTPVEDLKTVYEVYSSTGVRDKAGVILYALGWTQHTVGVQNIRSFTIVQLLLGNIGVAGGGVAALRGQPNVQGSTDQAILAHILPGYLKTPTASLTTLDEYLAKNTPKTREPQSANWYQNTPKYMVSLLKTWYGDKATKENGFAYSYLPKNDDGQDTTLLDQIDKMYAGKIKGFTCVGQNPACSNPNSNKTRKALAKLDWMVHINIFDNETASFWKGPGMDPKKVKTEVFLLPAAAQMEKAGSMSNTGRWLQWKYAAETPPGDALSMGDILYRLVMKLKDLYKKEKGTFPDPILDLQWNYADAKGMYDSTAVAKAMNGYFLEDVTVGDKSFKKGECVPGFSYLQADGKTSCGIWIHCGSFTQDGTNLIARRKKDDPTGLGLYPEWAWAWPMNRRILYNRASVDENGQPWDPKRAVLKWVDGKWVGDVPDGPWPPLADKEKGKLPFIMKPDGVASLFGPGLVDGPFPEHYEPLENPLEKSLMSAQSTSPVIRLFKGECDKIAGCDPRFPFVCTTYSCTEHWCTGADTRWQSWLTEAMPQAYVEISKELAKIRGIKNGDKVKLASVRGEVECVAMVTVRLRPMKVAGQILHQVGTTYNYGWLFPKDCGDSANLLTPTAGDPNTQTPEYKAFMVNVTKL